MPETKQYFEGLLCFDMIPESTGGSTRSKLIAKLCIDSEPSILTLRDYTEDLSGPELSLGMDRMANVWVQSMSLHPQVRVNGIPLWEERMFRRASSRSRRLKIGDLIEVYYPDRVLRFNVSKFQIFFARPPPTLSSLQLQWDIHEGWGSQ